MNSRCVLVFMCVCIGVNGDGGRRWEVADNGMFWNVHAENWIQGQIHLLSMYFALGTLWGAYIYLTF